MYSRPDLSVVRIYQQQEVVGAGFLVSDEYIMTCAHVVATALGINADCEQKPSQEQEVELDFPNIKSINPNIKLIERLTAIVEFWLPVNPGNAPEDIAVLKLTKLPPKEAQPAYLSMTKYQLSAHEFEAFGFPEGRRGGAWAKGYINKYVGDGWIQLDGSNRGYRLEEGFSGTPIWDEKLGAIVGMAVAADKLRPEIKAAFMIPTELLLQAWDRLSAVGRIDSRIQSLITILKPYFQDFKNLIENAYQQSLPQFSIRNFPDSIPAMIKRLDSCTGEQTDEFLALDKFVGYLYLAIQKKDNNSVIIQQLRQWLENYTSNYQRLINSLEQEQNNLSRLASSKSPCLLVGIFEENKALNVRAWLIRDSEQYNPNQGLGCDRLTDEKNKLTTDRELNNLSELIKGFHEQCLAICKSNLKKIYVSLPYKLIDRHQAIDKIIMEDGNRFAPCIGIEYEVAIRFSERFKSVDTVVDKYLFSCLDKWKIVKNKRNTQEQIIVIVDNSELNNPENLFQKLIPQTTVGFSTDRPIAKSDLISIMEVFYYSGIPIALWIRDDLQNLNTCHNIEDFCQECCFDNLSSQIKMRRCQDWKRQAIGNHLSFLLENFDLMPPQHLLSMS